MEFPRLVYKSAAEHTVADTKEEFDLLRKDGWFASVPEALAGEHEVAKHEPAADAAPTRAELEEKATELGIKFGKKTTDAKLSAAITEKL
jgi:hypothetical protein